MKLLPQKVSKIALISLLIFVLFVSPIAAETEAPVNDLSTESAAAFLEEFFSIPDIESLYQGAAVTIVKDGEVLAQEGFGFSDVETGTAVDPEHTIFRVASVSKSFTAIAIMQLVEEGKIVLEEDIREYLGDIDYENPYDQPVTVSHLLTHTSGFEIRDPNPEDIHTNFDLFVEIEDYVRANMPPVVREPGSSYMYGNFDSLLQGLIVQKVSGMRFEAYMEEHIFTPLGMEDSGFLLDGKLKDNLATGYAPTGEALELYTLSPTIMPHGGMLTTASDMGKFMTAFVNGGEGEAGRILTEESIQEMTEYRTAIHPVLPNTTYGFEAAFPLPGAGSSDQIITKAGDLNGFSSYLWFIPEENAGVFITYNNNNGLRDMLYPAFMSQFFPQYISPAELAEFVPAADQDLTIFEGHYVDLRLASMISKITLGNDGQLILSNAFLGDLPLVQVDDLLFSDPNGMFIGFKQHADGSIAYMAEPYLNPLGYTAQAQAAAGFSDITEDHPYAESILAMQSLGLYPNVSAEAFEPERPVTRAEYIQNLLKVSGLPGSVNPSEFPDVAGHPAEAEIQFAYELGLVSGNELGQFEPDRPITRQEAATVVWRSYMSLYSPDHFESIELAGETAAWAVPAVKMMVGLGLYGPEAITHADGSVDFRSTELMLRQEEAVHHYLLLTKPTLNVTVEETAEELPVAQ